MNMDVIKFIVLEREFVREAYNALSQRGQS
jgi:hypothetical protein